MKTHITSNRNRPEKTFRRGAVQAAIWTNYGLAGAFYQVTFSRRFRALNGSWQTSFSFGVTHLSQVAILSLRCCLWMCTHTPPKRRDF